MPSQSVNEIRLFRIGIGYAINISIRYEPDYSQEYPSLLAKLGRLEAKKVARVWYATRHGVDAYRRLVNE
jgi:hypothetical protein